ncbi:MAG: ArsR family transcriptional regulator [Actinomycetota bacterium]|nr:MAG: ArsR family transcriptional regulator [Actinomycetota bacterium]
MSSTNQSSQAILESEKPMSDSITPRSVASLSDAVHQRSRLAILAALYELSKADFRQLQKTTGLTEGNLGRHIQVLENAGLVIVEKGYSGRKPHTHIEITKEGIHAFEDEVRVLKDLVAKATRDAKSTIETKSGSRKVMKNIGIPGPIEA